MALEFGVRVQYTVRRRVISRCVHGIGASLVEGSLADGQSFYQPSYVYPDIPTR